MHVRLHVAACAAAVIQLSRQYKQSHCVTAVCATVNQTAQQRARDLYLRLLAVTKSAADDR